MKDYEDWKAAGNEKNEENEAKEKGWKEILEQLFSLVKELQGRASASGQKAEKNAEGGEEEVSVPEGEQSTSVDAWFQKKQGRSAGDRGATLP